MLRTAYYMHSETEGRLPWTDKGLYDWMVGSVAGVNMVAAGCDATDDLTNLGSYGVQYWLESSWVSGAINVSIACSAPLTAQDYAEWSAQQANLYRQRIAANPRRTPPGRNFAHYTESPRLDLE